MRGEIKWFNISNIRARHVPAPSVESMCIFPSRISSAVLRHGFLILPPVHVRRIGNILRITTMDTPDKGGGGVSTRRGSLEGTPRRL